MLLIKNMLFFTYLVLSNFAFFDRIIELLDERKWKSLIIFSAVWALATFSLWLLSNDPIKKNRIFGFCFISVGTICSYSYYKVSSHFLTFQDMELLWLAKAQAGQAISFYFGQALYIIGISFIGFLAFLFQPMALPKFKFSTTLLTAFIFLPLPLLMGITYKKAGYGTEGMPHQFTALSTFILYQGHDTLYPSMTGIRDSVSWVSSEKKDVDKNIIFIVDESIRSDYIDLNKFRQTTPFLMANKEKIANYGSMSSGNNCSGYSNIILRTGVSPSSLGEVGNYSLIWNYAKKAGYTTVYLDAQQKAGVLQNFMDSQEVMLIDEFIQFEAVEPHLKDQAIADKISEYQNKSGKYFIYVNKRGAHFPYNETYAIADEKFQPSMGKSEVLGENKINLINSYKNSIFTGVDKFFESFFESIYKKESTIFYTADHGQNLMDQGIMTHCNTLDPHETEGQVPFLIITSNNEKHEYFKKYALKSKNKLTHFHIFGSLLKEMGYLENDIKSLYSLDLEGNTLIPRQFSTGGIIERFGKATNWKDI